MHADSRQESLSVQETALGRSSSGQVPKVEYGAEGGRRLWSLAQVLHVRLLCCQLINPCEIIFGSLLFHK